MRRHGVVESTIGSTGTSDHLCWGYQDEDDRRRAVAAWLQEGLDAGQRAWLVTDAATDVATELGGLADHATRMASGALQVLVASDVYGRGTLLLDDQLACYDRAVTAASADGYAGLRVAADVTALLGAEPSRLGHLRWEHVADRYAARHPFAAMCMYDARVIADGDAMSCLHPLRRGDPPPPPFNLYADGDVVRLTGEVDGLFGRTLQEVLDVALHDGDADLDVSQLRFVDGRAARVLHDTLVGRKRRGGRSIHLTGAPDQLRRVWALCGFDVEVLAP